MTMDNGEGRPLDELESGHEDPQGWYFDLPSDAWKRQEEKNRLLRERVRKNEAEPAEPERRDPFVLRRSEPEPPKKRGLFGFGKKKRGDEDEHPAGRREEPTAGRPGWLTADDGDADEWSTERVPFDPSAEEPALRLRPRARGEEPVDRPVGGPEVPPTPAPVEPPPLRLRSRTEPEQGSRLNWDFGPGAWPETPAKGGAEPPVDSPEDEESIFARMQAWAERGREEQHRRLGLGHPQDVQAEEGSAPHGDDAAASAASQWPDAAAPEPPLANEHDAPGAAVGAGGLDDREAGEPAHGLELPPLRLRREPADAQREERKSSRWDEFFGLNREEGEEDGPGFSEGLAAMREWAKKKPLGDDIREIPEEFLKPFDWELEEQGQAGGDARQDDPFAAFRVSGEPGPGADRQAGAPAWVDSTTGGDAQQDDPFAAFRVSGEPGPGTDPEAGAAAWVDSATGGDAQQDDPFAAFRVSGEPGPGADREAGAAGDDDPLAGIFAPRDVTEASETPKEKRGLFGRLFGRKRQDGPGDEPAAPLAADWLFEPAEAAPAEPLRAADAPSAWIRADADNGAPEEAWGASAGPTFAQDRTVAEGFAAEVRAQDAPVTAGTFGSTRAEQRLTAEGADVSFDRAEEPAEDEEWAPEPVPQFQALPEPGPGAGTAAVIEPQAAPDDEEEWAPEPVLPFAAPPAAAGEVPAGEAAGETSSAQDGAAWEPESAELSPSAFGAAVQAAFWSAPAVDDAPAAERPWWETPEAEETTESVVGSEPVAVQPEAAAAERPWWETPEAEETTEDVVGSEPVAVQPEATVAERPWWETPEAEETTENVVGSEPVAVQPEATVAERPWWEAPEAEETAGSVAGSEPVAVQPEAPAEERPWWEAPEAEETTENVVGSEPVAVRPEATAAERPWWEAPEAEETTETVVGSEPVAVRPEATAEERPWWETPEAEETTENVVGSEPVAVQPEATAAERPWWEAPEAEETAEAVAGSEPVAVQPEATAEERPWWERPAGFEPSDGWTQAQPAAAQREDRDTGSDDMWGDIAETAELAAAGSGDSGELDLAASLEAQLGAPLDEPAWTAPSPPAHEDDAFRSTEDEGDVILKAFEAHASTPDLEEDPAEAAALEAETAAALSALFGDNATEIVAEAGEEPPERPFIRLGAWAPQRSLPADDGWAPEEEVRQELDARTNPLGFMADPLAGTPPWLSEAETGEDERPERAGSDGKLKAWVREVVETVMLAALVFLSVRASFGNFKVDGNSMYPTLENGEFLIVNKLVYSEVDLEKLSNFLPFIDPGSDPTRYVFHGPQRGDIIVLRDPRDPNTDLIKRVIGLPGETIEIVNGKVYINDRLLEEPYITTPWNDTLPKILIPEDEYFVMGDNRNNSLDSRSAQVGLVSKDLIIGKATLTYLPLNRFGLAPNEKGVLTEQKPVLTTKRIGEE